MSSEAKNLEVIYKAMDRHAENCGRDLIEIQMNPYEVERLGWEEIRGVPVVGEESLGTGRFRLICEGDHEPDEEIEAVAREPVTA